MTRLKNGWCPSPMAFLKRNWFRNDNRLNDAIDEEKWQDKIANRRELAEKFGWYIEPREIPEIHIFEMDPVISVVFRFQNDPDTLEAYVILDDVLYNGIGIGKFFNDITYLPNNRYTEESEFPYAIDVARKCVERFANCVSIGDIRYYSSPFMNSSNSYR